MSISAVEAAGLLHRGGVIAYPTEAVWGLGCDPLNENAVMRLLHIKQRTVDKGLILIAASINQLSEMVDWNALPTGRRHAVEASWPGPHTWIVPATAHVPTWIQGQQTGVAVRVSAHATVIDLCNAFGGVLVSTSANWSSEPPARNAEDIGESLIKMLDGVVVGVTGRSLTPTPIRDALTGATLRF